MTLAYSLVKNSPPNDMRTAAQLACAECDDKGKIIIAGIGNNPALIQQLFVRIGWDSDVFHASKNWCPKCVGQRKIRRAAAIAASQPPAPPKHFEEPKPMTPNTNAFVSVPTTVFSSTPKGVKDLTNTQKALLREELDKHFDTDNGRYTNGHSDRVISEAMTIPMVVVIEFREMLYGEIKEDPKLVEIRFGMTQAERRILDLQTLLAQLKAKLADIEKVTK